MEESLSWVSHPAKNNLKGVVIAVGSIGLSGLLIGLIVGSNAVNTGFSAGWALFSAGILIFSLRGFFWPTRYDLSEKGITVQGFLNKREKSWSQCKSIRLDPTGVLVSPFAFETRLENYRGVYLRFEKNKQEVLDYLKAHMQNTDCPSERSS